MWNIQRMPFKVEGPHYYNDFFGRVPGNFADNLVDVVNLLSFPGMVVQNECLKIRGLWCLWRQESLINAYNMWSSKTLWVISALGKSRNPHHIDYSLITSHTITLSEEIAKSTDCHHLRQMCYDVPFQLPKAKNGGRSRVCPNFYCSSLYVISCNQNLVNVLDHRKNMPPNILRMRVYIKNRLHKDVKWDMDVVSVLGAADKWWLLLSLPGGNLRTYHINLLQRIP